LELSRVEELLRARESEFKGRVQRMEEMEAKKYEIEREIFNGSLAQKNEYIGQLEKEVRSLSAMLCYWKPLDEQEERHSELQRQDSHVSREHKEDKASSNRFRLPSEQFGMDSAASEHSNVGDYSLRVDYLSREEEGIFKRTVTENRSNSLHNTKEREKTRKECSKKYSEQAKKTRKVDLNDIR
jgi:hypothetical protein